MIFLNKFNFVKKCEIKTICEVWSSKITLDIHNFGWRAVMLNNRKILGRRGAWGVTACFLRTQQIKAPHPNFEWRRVILKNREILGRCSFFGGLRNWGPAYLTYKLSNCWGGTHMGNHARRGPTPGEPRSGGEPLSPRTPD